MTPFDLKAYLDNLIRKNLQISTMIWGPPGIDKPSLQRFYLAKSSCNSRMGAVICCGFISSHGHLGVLAQLVQKDGKLNCGICRRYCVNTVRLSFCDENYKSQRCDKSPSRQESIFRLHGDLSRLFP